MPRALWCRVAAAVKRRCFDAASRGGEKRAVLWCITVTDVAFARQILRPWTGSLRTAPWRSGATLAEPWRDSVSLSLSLSMLCVCECVCVCVWCLCVRGWRRSAQVSL